MRGHEPTIAAGCSRRIRVGVQPGSAKYGCRQILDGTDGAAPGVEHALNAALASPVEIQQFWEKHGGIWPASGELDEQIQTE